MESQTIGKEAFGLINARNYAVMKRKQAFFTDMQRADFKIQAVSMQYWNMGKTLLPAGETCLSHFLALREMLMQ